MWEKKEPWTSTSAWSECILIHPEVGLLTHRKPLNIAQVSFAFEKYRGTLEGALLRAKFTSLCVSLVCAFGTERSKKDPKLPA